MQRQSVHLKVDDAVIQAGNVGKIADAYWWSVDIYNGPAAYEACLQPFSSGQRLLHAYQWYTSEVSNGGHEQFFCNPTGVVWRNALKALKAMGLTEEVSILQAAVDRFEVGVPDDQLERGGYIEDNEVDFHDLDERLFALLSQERMKSSVLQFIRSRPKDFYFDGVIEKSVM